MVEPGHGPAGTADVRTNKKIYIVKEVCDNINMYEKEPDNICVI